MTRITRRATVWRRLRALDHALDYLTFYPQPVDELAQRRTTADIERALGGGR
ncbi:hypothetical protein [Prauserella flavalba]|uniref:hypothetical protein n=1 Tax=Prauserella flavalba TaxID=1477506 RepID=UPI00143D10CA|nr:hypothetical protein [Prauserella flavalba]